MDDVSLRWIKFKRRLCLWSADVASESKAPLFDANARLNYLAIAVLLFLLLPKRSDERLLGQAISSLEAVEAFLYTFPVFVVLNAIFAIFRVARKERETGAWFGPKYVFNDPLHIATLLIDAGQNGAPHELRVPEVEGGSLVAYRVDIDRTDERVKTQIQFPGAPPTFNRDVISKLTRTTCRLPPSRRMSLYTQSQPEATPTTIRVYVLGFEVGKG